MNKEEFLEYIRTNYDLSGEAFRLVKNIVDFIEANASDEAEQYSMACELLDGTIGLSDAELRRIYF